MSDYPFVWVWGQYDPRAPQGCYFFVSEPNTYNIKCNVGLTVTQLQIMQIQ